MEAVALNQIRSALLRKRDALADWLRTTARTRKEALLGPAAEGAVHAQLAGIDATLAKADDHTLGRCEVCQGEVEPVLLEVDYTACVCIEHYSGEERRQLERELELAQAVQKALLPQAIPPIPGLELAAFTRPSHIVGGDYFDFLTFGNGQHALIIADVAGHGVSAGLHMAGIQALLRALVPLNQSPAEVMRQVHKLFIHNIRFDTFVTFFIGAFDAPTRTLTYCNAGHPPPLVVHPAEAPGDVFDTLPPTAAALGLVEDALFADRSIELQTRDLLVMYTDGVTEAMDAQNRRFGQERLVRLGGQANGQPVQEVLQTIRLRLEEFRAGQPAADDTTIVVGQIR
jgi:sigma-B regulation protein RsbU (phosphoserine phosphatase)